MPKRLAKALAHGFFLVLAFPAAFLAGFGRWHGTFSIFANSFALVPGILGDYIRSAYYRLTLTDFSAASRIQFGSFFAHPDVTVGPHVYIGSYCILGKVAIGEHTQIASGVQVLSGSRQHSRDALGRISGSEDGQFSPVSIGAHCWIGAGAIVMADVGEGSTIGAGSVVTRPIPPRSTAVGSPAKVIHAAAQAD